MELQEAVERFYYDLVLNELRMMNGSLRDPNVSYNSVLYLELIHYRPNCTASYLAQALHVSRSAVTAKVGELIRQGLVKKERSAEDRRIYYLRVCDDIAAEYRTFDRQTQHAIRRMRGRFPERELEQFARMMEAFSEFYWEDSSDGTVTGTEV